MGFVWYGENKEHWNSKFIADIFYAKGEILSLLKQLKVGGRLVIPIGNKSQTMLRVTKKSNTKYEKEKFGKFRFVPLLKNKN